MDVLIGWFPQSKRRLYARELLSLSNYQLTRRDQSVKAFVKNEKLKIEDKDGDPRMIQARTPRFNLMLGQFTRPLEKVLYTLVDPDLGTPLIAKGLNMRRRAEVLRLLWESLRNPVCVSGDLSRWDMHVSPEMMAVVHAFYTHFIKDPVFRQLLAVQLKNKGFTSDNVKYAVDGSVMSGDMTTALGNCVLAVLALTMLAHYLKNEDAMEVRPLREYLRARGVKPIPRGVRRVIRILDDGDDHVVMCERDLAPTLKAILPHMWEAVGHEFKVEGETDDFNQILFCQHKPLYHHGMWEMMPDPHKVLATALVSTGDNCADYKQQRKYQGTVWEARALLHQGMPILGPLFHRLSKWETHRIDNPDRRRTTVAGLERLALADGREKVVLTRIEPTAREQVYRMWGVEVDQQYNLENNLVLTHRDLREAETTNWCHKMVPYSLRRDPYLEGKVGMLKLIRFWS